MIVENAMIQLGVAGATLYVLNQTLTKLLPAILKMAMRPIEEILTSMVNAVGELTTELRTTRDEFSRTTRIVQRIETKIDMQFDLTPSPIDLPKKLLRRK